MANFYKQLFLYLSDYFWNNLFQIVMYKDRLRSRSRDVSTRSESGSRESSDMNVDNQIQRTTKKTETIFEHHANQIIEESKVEYKQEVSSNEETSYECESNSEESEDLNKTNKDMSIDNEELKEKNYEEEPLKLTQKQIKEKLLNFYKSNFTAKEVIAKKIKGIAPSTVYRHYSNFKKMGDSPRKIGTGIQNKMNSQTIKAIEDLLYIDDTLTTKEIAKRMQKDGLNVSHSSIYRYLKDKYEYREVDESKVLTEDQKKARVQWCQRFLKYDWENVIFTDEVIFRCSKKIKNDGLKKEMLQNP